jgi:DNA-binding NarL/FixJ family response regulator
MSFDIVVVDDHRVVRDGIRAILMRDPEFRVVGEADDGAGALRVCQETNPDLVLMDISLPGVNGIEATVQLAKQFPNIKVVILSMYDDERSVMGAIRAGARGFVLKQASFGEVLNALRVVARGGTYLSSAISSRLVERLQRGSLETVEKSPLELLSPRELQVLRLVAEGKSSKEVATILKLEHSTIRSYRKTMMKKLGVTNLAGLIQVAVAAGLTPHGIPPGPTRDVGD